MLLAIDVGNTNIVAGVFAGDSLVTLWRLTTETRRTGDEYALLLSGLFRLAGLDVARVQGVAVCSVVPPVLTALTGALEKHWGLSPLVISTQLDLGIEVRYTPPTAIGADRIANAVAAIDRFGAPSVVVDFGTTTNFDVISPDGAYIGGILAPGLEISEEALYRSTAQLRRVPLVPPPTAIGGSTTAALQSGILFGYAGLVDGLVERICGELGGQAHVVATGGLAETIAPLTRTVQRIDDDLTLYGLFLLYRRNAPDAGD
ncbi:MAG: type III pantothenate kinase [Chloroflexi bacterium]|nr:type III pantothenate kinase [Chloroflexota bacterium]